jgi:hypothetical protein
MVFALVAAFAVITPASAQTVEQDMFVSVLDRSDKPVLTLGPPDFIVRQDGRIREVLRARRASDVMDIAILVDTSQALGSKVSDVRRGLEAFVARMRGQARIAIVGLGDRPTIHADYTGDPALLAAGIGRLFPISGAGAYVLDAVALVLEGLEKQKPERSAIVVVWAGGREFGNESDSVLIERLTARGAALHVLTIGTGMPADGLTTEGQNRERLFDRGTSVTGGRRAFLLSSMAMTDALDRLSSELLGQYRITFARPDSLIPPEKTEVSVRPAGLTARGVLVPVRGASAR